MYVVFAEVEGVLSLNPVKYLCFIKQQLQRLLTIACVRRLCVSVMIS